MAKIATDSFELALPETWQIESLHNPATVIGPCGECLMVNSAIISGGKSERDYQAVRHALQQNADDSMRLATDDSRLKITVPLTKEITDNGLFAELHCVMADGQGFFSEFSIAGPATLVFATLEGPQSATVSVQVIRDAVRDIAWALPFGDHAPRQKHKQWWKFW